MLKGTKPLGALFTESLESNHWMLVPPNIQIPGCVAYSWTSKPGCFAYRILLTTKPLGALLRESSGQPSPWMPCLQDPPDI